MPVFTISRPVRKIIGKILVFTLSENKVRMRIFHKIAANKQLPTYVNRAKNRENTYSRTRDCSLLSFHVNANFCGHITFPVQCNEGILEIVKPVSLYMGFIASLPVWETI